MSLTPSVKISVPKWVGKNARRQRTDRKSTRLNSSHSQISYAVFCLKKKKKTEAENRDSNITILIVTLMHTLPADAAIGAALPPTACMILRDRLQQRTRVAVPRLAA